MQFTTNTHPFPLLALLLLLGLALGHHHHHRHPRLPTPPPPPSMHEGELPTFWLGAGYDAGGDAAATTASAPEMFISLKKSQAKALMSHCMTPR